MVVAVRLESRGHGLFTQTRVGQNGRLFKVYKMRTMCADAEERKQELSDVDEGNGVLFKMRRDPRITRRRWHPAQDLAGRAAPAAQRGAR